MNPISETLTKTMCGNVYENFMERRWGIVDGHTKEKLNQMNRQARETDSLYHKAALRFGMSDCTFWILYVLLSEEGELTQQDLCEQWNFIKQTLNSAVNGLCRKGYLILEQVPGTKNRKILRLTKAGMDYAKGTVLKVIEAEQAALDRMEDGQLHQLLKLKRKSLALLSEEFEKLYDRF